MASPEESDVALKMKNPARPCPTARPSRGEPGRDPRAAEAAGPGNQPPGLHSPSGRGKRKEDQRCSP